MGDWKVPADPKVGAFTAAPKDGPTFQPFAAPAELELSAPVEGASSQTSELVEELHAAPANASVGADGTRKPYHLQTIRQVTHADGSN